MKRLLIAILSFALMLPVFAQDEVTESKLVDKLEIGVEYTNLEKKVPDAKPISFYSPSLTLGAYGTLRDIDVSTVVANIGYKVSDNLTPYLILGGGSVEYLWRMDGFIGSTTLPLLTHQFEAQGVVYGFGLRGKLLDLPKDIKLLYDVRRTQLQIDDDEDTLVLPGILDYSATTESDIDYGEYNVNLVLAKTFEVGEVIKTITPYAGYRFTSIDYDISNRAIALGGELIIEYSLRGTHHSLILGAEAQVTDNVSVFVDGVVLDEEGVRTGVTYTF
jgi:hypothetical protein